MSNSAMVQYTKLSPNCNPRKHGVYNPTGAVSKITVHHAAGVVSVESLGSLFARQSRQASANYGIGSDGRVAMFVPEDSRAWTSGSRENDYKAITIEVSNSQKGGTWPVSDRVMEVLIELCADICRRNGFRLEYTGKPEGSLTAHKMFEATACPGRYLEGKLSCIAREVNRRLAEDTAAYRVIAGDYPTRAAAEAAAQELKARGYSPCILVMEAEKLPEETPAEPESRMPAEGDIVQFKGGMQYGNANAAAGTACPAGQAKITKTAPGKRHPYHLVRTGKTGPYGWVDAGTFTGA